MSVHPTDYRQASFEITAALARTGGKHSLGDLIALACERFGCDAACLLEKTDEYTAVCRSSATIDPMVESISDPAILSEILRTHKVIAISEYRTSPDTNATLLGWGAQSIVLIPAAVNEEAGTGAALLLAWKQPQNFPIDFAENVSPVWALLQALYPREKVERDLAEAQERLSAILETVPQAVVFIDNDGERGWVNGPAAILFDLPTGDVSPLRISNAMRDLRASATNAAALQREAAQMLRDAHAEIRDWIWEFEKPRCVFSVTSRITNVHDVVGRIWVLADITALTAAQRALAGQEERWQLALQGTNEGIWDWNALNGSVFYSPRWKEMLGYAEDELPNRADIWEPMVHPADVDRVKAELQRHLDRKTPYYHAEYRIRCKDDSWKWVLARGKAIWDAEGHPMRLVGAHSDITDQKRAEDSLREAKQIADEANSAKSQFLARMSHEIRTPMNAICGLSDLLYETELDDEQLEYVRVFRTNADRLLRLINNILDLSRMEASALELEISAFELNHVLARVHDLFLATAKQKQIDLTFILDPVVPTVVRGDPDRLEQILVNLVGNALKFTDEGYVAVTVKPEGSHVAFEVKDSGPGIKAHQTAQIFEPFVQADSLTTRKHVGTGLGLAIAKKLVEKMDGEIGVESEFGKGSRFFFTAVLEPDTEAAVVETTAAPAVTAIDRFALEHALNILIAEDVEDNRFLLRAYLRDLPFELDFAEDGAVALRKAFAKTYDIILMDMQMPELDGFAATRHIRAYEQSRKKPPVPIIALTAFALAEEADRCLEAGCTAYLSKPLRKSDLLEALARHMPKVILHVDEGHGDDMDDLAEEIRELIPDYLADCSNEAENLANYVETGDFAAMERMGHNLKGSGGSFGMPRLTEIGAKIWDGAKARDTQTLRRQVPAFRDAILEGLAQYEKGEQSERPSR